jgi:hypothetical protein
MTRNDSALVWMLALLNVNVAVSLWTLLLLMWVVK